MEPQVGLIMGLDSDWPTVKPAAEVLAEFGVAFEVGVVSAHRTPEKMLAYAKSAHERGLQVIIACAGGAAHLPGMVAAATRCRLSASRVRLRSSTVWTRCCPSCRCRAACRLRPCPSAAQERLLAGRAHPRCWRSCPDAEDGRVPREHGRRGRTEGREPAREASRRVGPRLPPVVMHV